ncbi:arylsulfatase [bacterium]|nr:arylsulfatase [bacterium]
MWRILLPCLCLFTNVVAAAPPNVLIILADDLGFSDLGCYGGEIATPNLDTLAKEGSRHTQFYNTARCWPSRAAILTGYYPQQIRRDALPGVKSGGRGKRPAWAPLLPTLLKPKNYRSYHSGKWHLDGMPLAEGFDHSYYLKDQGRFFNPKVHYQDDKQLPSVEPKSGYYGTVAVADHAINQLRDHAEHFPEQPFFQYLAFAAPHFPLHALPEDIERYKNHYDSGWDSIRKERWQRQQALGLLNGAQLSPTEQDLGPPYHFAEALEILSPGEVNRPLPWNTLTGEQQAFQATKMAIHAAMVDRMDKEIGRVIDQLKLMKAYENTLIVFLSDNGASAEIMVRDDGHDPKAAPGSAATYLCLGPGWSTTCNTPFRKHKTWVHEGGIATPFIARWPASVKERPDTDSPSHVIDLVPTILDLAEIETPARPGVSLFEEPTAPRELWWMHEGNRAFRQGNCKLVAVKNGPWELYDLLKDRAETKNLAKDITNKVIELARLWELRWQSFQKDAKSK